MALVIGDSQVKFFHNLFKDDNIVTICNPEYSFSDIIEDRKLEELIPAFSVVAIFAGANDLVTNDFETILENIWILSEKIKRVNKSAKIIMCDILPSGINQETDGYMHPEFIEFFNDKANFINHQIELMSSQVSWISHMKFEFLYDQANEARVELISKDKFRMSQDGIALFG